MNKKVNNYIQKDNFVLLVIRLLKYIPVFLKFLKKH